MNVPQFAYALPVDGLLDCPIKQNTNKATKKICVQTLYGHMLSFLFGKWELNSWVI